MSTKICNSCEIKKDVKFFYKKIESNDGLNKRCKLCCDYKITKEKMLLHKGLKTCNTCKLVLELSNFSDLKASRTGKDYSCKKCQSKNYVAKNKNNSSKVLSLKGEVWRDIPSYKDFYQASNLGRLKAKDIPHKTPVGTDTTLPEALLKQSINPWGYKYISLTRLGGSQKVFSHRLIAEAFVPNPEDKPFIDHIDANRGNNKIDNLRWCTARENQHYRQKKEDNESNYTGVSRKGGKNWIARIQIEGKSYALGGYEEEYDAYLAYQKALKNWEEKGIKPEHKRKNNGSKYTGLTSNGKGGFSASFKFNKINNYVGFFKDEELAYYWLTEAKKNFLKNGKFTKYTKGTTKYVKA